MTRKIELIKALILTFLIVFSIISASYNEKGIGVLAFLYLLASIVNLILGYEIYVRGNYKIDLFVQINLIFLAGMTVIELFNFGVIS